LSDYFIGETEVTQELWEAVMGSNPSEFKDSKNPVENVSLDDCQEFVKRLNELTGKTFRLPTEAEWEYAARGGHLSKGYKYPGSNNPDDVAWTVKTVPDQKLRPVKQLLPNELGLYDMAGNAWEWVSDYSRKYTSEPQVDPVGDMTSSKATTRGGSTCNAFT
jgi:formylglycine-generating enzyme required for sulfatase activity